MKIIDPSFEILSRPPREEALQLIERAGRTCYKSEDRITPDSASEFVRRIVHSGHHSVIEHVAATVKFICDRGVSHELVRHRLASFSQESTRYCNYKDTEITFIKPGRYNFLPCGSYTCWYNTYREWFVSSNRTQESICQYLPQNVNDDVFIWLHTMSECETSYKQLIEKGCRPEEARDVLPNSLKTEIVMTANIREWRHVFNQRCAAAAHPEMQRIMIPLREDFQEWLPEVFE